jgi:hypothetical protein
LNLLASFGVKTLKGERHWGPMLLCAAALVIAVFFTGGSSRPEVSSLEILRPLSIIALGLALMFIRRIHLRTYRVPLTFVMLCVGLVAVQLAPLPPGAASSMTGRGILAEIDAAAGLGAIWRPSAVSPSAALNAILALFVPLSVFVTGVQLAATDHGRLLVVVLAAGAASALLALLQILGDPQGSLYFYDTTNFGAAVGLFANRNHQAVLLACLLPLIFAAVRLPRAGTSFSTSTLQRVDPWLLVGLASTAFIVPLILITGSRSGLMMGGIALASLVLFVLGDKKILGNEGSWGSRRLKIWMGLVAVGILTLLAIWLQRALAIDRLLDGDAADDMRTKILPAMRDMITTYQPWGAGAGSFKDLYKASEPAGLLMPLYMNQAHNDWLDIALTGGIPALLVAATAAGVWVVRVIQVMSNKAPDSFNDLRKAALIVLLILAGASLSDYPLRTPALGILFVLATIWAAIPFGSAVGAAVPPTAPANTF